MMRRRAFWPDRGGASAAEFALVVPVFFALTIGAINLCILLFINTRLHNAVDAAARCMSMVDNPASSCLTPAATQTYAATTFGFPNLSPVFVATAGASGGCNKVTGAATYQLNAVVTSLPVTMSAQSCFPVQT